MNKKTSPEYFCKTLINFVEFSSGVPTDDQWEGIKNALNKVQIDDQFSIDKAINVIQKTAYKIKDTINKELDKLDDQK